MIHKLQQHSGAMLGAIKKAVKNRLFVATTIVPTALAALYFSLIASDIYISESRFVVRSPERSASSPLGLILKGAGFARAQDDSYTVQDFILSRDALKALNDELNVAKAYGSQEVDPVNRFAGLGFDSSFEALYLYYAKKVGVQLDSASSIATLTTRAFTADDSFKINRRLLELSEELVNKLNERGRQDMIRFAASEVADAETRAKAAGMALAQYRNRKGVIDPERQSTLPLQQVAKLQDELIAIKAQIAQISTVAKDNPQLPVLHLRAQLIEKEIQAETARVTGGEQSLAGKAAEYQRLVLEKEFADKMLASAMSTLEQARNEAQRKQVYLERIVQPNLPDHAVEPKRIRGIFATLAVGLLVFGLLTLLLAGVREHLD